MKKCNTLLNVKFKTTLFFIIENILLILVTLLISNYYKLNKLQFFDNQKPSIEKIEAYNPEDNFYQKLIHKPLYDSLVHRIIDNNDSIAYWELSNILIFGGRKTDLYSISMIAFHKYHESKYLLKAVMISDYQYYSAKLLRDYYLTKIYEKCGPKLIEYEIKRIFKENSRIPSSSYFLEKYDKSLDSIE